MSPTFTEYVMRRIYQLSVLCLAAGVVSACYPDQVVDTTTPPASGVRFINAVPDSSGAFGFDLRFVDIVESNAQFRISFRNAPSQTVTSGTTDTLVVGTSIQFKDAAAGSRHFRIFLSDTLQSIASTVVVDSTVTLVANHNYSFILWGNGRSPKGAPDAMHLTILDEAPQDPGTQVGLRLINATSAAVDGSAYARGTALPTSPTWASVAPFSATTWVTQAPGTIDYDVRASGAATAMFADRQALPGAAAFSSAGAGGKIDIDAVPGTTVAGSAVTVIVFPRSVAGARTPQTAPFQIPNVVTMWDRRPPRPSGV
jgi:Domain of unknown function (DUF4397)